jgi:hypothetical protein
MKKRAVVVVLLVVTLFPAAGHTAGQAVPDCAVARNAVEQGDVKVPFNREDKTLLKVLHAQLEKADAAIAAQLWEAADELIRQALAELGDRYVCPGTIDETGMKLIAADLQEREGKLDEAVRVRRKMLVARLEMLRGKTK